MSRHDDSAVRTLPSASDATWGSDDHGSGDPGLRSADPTRRPPNPVASWIRRWSLVLVVLLLVATVVYGRSATRTGATEPGPGGADAGAVPTVGSSQVYVVKSGDTVSGIAVRLGVDPAVLLAANGIDDPDRIETGQELTVPAHVVAGVVACPIPGGEFLPEFGYIKPTGKFHEGVDIYAGAETPVLAPADGRVTFEHGTIGGYQFTIERDDGVRFVGTHMTGYGPDPDGAQVTSGDVVGYVGASGNAVGGPPHLHFEIIVNGEPIDPYPTLVAAC